MNIINYISEQFRKPTGFWGIVSTFVMSSFLLTSCATTTKGGSHIESHKTLYKPETGNLNLLLAIPEVNFFHLKPENETTKNFEGFIGLGIGAEYFYKDNKSLQLRGDFITDFPVFVPAPYDWDESQPWENCHAFNISLTDNFRWKRFQTGYGLNLARNTWIQHAYYIEPEADIQPERIDGKTKTNTMLGLSLNTYYRFTEHFYFGVIYRPSFRDLSNNQMKYEHSISLDFMWKIYLK
jgi:predicted small secreted protein